MTDLLDDPIRAALTMGSRALMLGTERAMRFPAEVAPFAATADSSALSFDALAALVHADERVALVSLDALAPPDTFRVESQAPILQMILGTPPTPIDTGEPPHLLLGTADVPDMLALAQQTRPGPFGRRTIELGNYFGLRSDGTLIAMAGERMRFGPFVEISAVCVDPEYRGKGYAGLLMARLARRIQARSLTPILHVLENNTGAIALYERLGFRTRRTMWLNVLAATNPASKT